MGDPSVDAVFILTNMESHAKLAIMAMDAKKHVLVEKPVASTIAELHAMKAASLRNAVALIPGHNYIYEPWFERTRALIDSGDLGRITACYVMYALIMRRHAASHISNLYGAHV